MLQKIINSTAISIPWNIKKNSFTREPLLLFVLKKNRLIVKIIYRIIYNSPPKECWDSGVLPERMGHTTCNSLHVSLCDFFFFFLWITAWNASRLGPFPVRPLSRSASYPSGLLISISHQVRCVKSDMACWPVRPPPTITCPALWVHKCANSNT